MADVKLSSILYPSFCSLSKISRKQEKKRIRRQRKEEERKRKEEEGENEDLIAEIEKKVEINPTINNTEAIPEGKG